MVNDHNHEVTNLPIYQFTNYGFFIGGSGFIGPHVAHALERRGHDVVVFTAADARRRSRSSGIGQTPFGDYDTFSRGY